MENEIMSYFDMCLKEGGSLQKGMNFHYRSAYSIILMSTRKNAPYRDVVEDNGRTLIYEGHDIPRSDPKINPKDYDQLETSHNGNLTENGKFHHAAQEYKNSGREPEIIKVYEKIRDGIWSYNGQFYLIDSWKENDGKRQVFKFKLQIADDEKIILKSDVTFDHRRIIPSMVKQEVWKRDGGKCAICGSSDELHFDHIIPYSKGGTSLDARNIQLLCA